MEVKYFYCIALPIASPKIGGTICTFHAAVNSAILLSISGTCRS